MHNSHSFLSSALVLTSSVLCGANAYGHPLGHGGAEPLAWNNEQIGLVIAGGDYVFRARTRELKIEGNNCVSASTLNFNVRDEYAFDIDETVQLEVEFYVPSTAQHLQLIYDRSDTAPAFNGVVDSAATKEFTVTSSTDWSTQSFALERARFSNSLFYGTDFSISYVPRGGKDATGAIVDLNPGPHTLTVCGVRLKRSYTTASPRDVGSVEIEIVNEHGAPTPARVGIYDTSGRLVMPSENAIPLKNYNNTSRIVTIRPGAVPWPSKSHAVFYVDGSYRSTLPAGEYELVIAKGLEYHLQHRRFSVHSKGRTKLKIALTRWTDMNAKGWYSGDDHIHYSRETSLDDHNLLLFTEAEDLNLGNILQMGNSGNFYFRQYNWKKISNSNRSTFVLVPGQEDPRTVRRGHAIQLNIKRPIRDPERYLLYHEVFSRARSQGGTTGYAHIGWSGGDGLGGRAGMALDVPFGLVDFVEVLQAGNLDPKTWFDFLNLGYKLSPSAGTDYPYADVPGAVRSYVQVGHHFTPQRWFDGLRQGRNFVTNGPMLTFLINHQEIGSELNLRRGDSLAIEATARINPDVDQLTRLELIEQGEVIKTVASETGTKELRLNANISATHGSWFVIRAVGTQHSGPDEFWGRNVIGMSAPTYVHVDGQGSWKPSAVPVIVEDLEKDLQAVLSDNRFEIESWDTDAPDARYWEENKRLLKQRVDQVTGLYESLVQRASAAR